MKITFKDLNMTYLKTSLKIAELPVLRSTRPVTFI